MKHIVFLYRNGSLVYTGYAGFAVKRLRENHHRIRSADDLVQRIQSVGYFDDYEAHVVAVDGIDQRVAA